MNFGILGPLEVRRDGGDVPLPGAKPKAVLAMLLLHANQPVTPERLAVALWGEEAREGAVKTVQVHVSRLRKALADAERLTRTDAGYRLRVDAGELDSERFEALTVAGQRALEAGDPQRAGEHLRGALALWRGPPLGDLGFEPFAQAAIARLEERRWEALEARIDADLRAGRHTAIASELQDLIARQPLREHLRAQLMLALYRSGRQADALATFHAVRETLIEELGVEPGPELRALYDAILRQDRSLTVEPRPAPAPVPRRTGLLERERELETLVATTERAIDGGGALMAIEAHAGLGKSRLLSEARERAATRGFRVLRAAGNELEREFAFGVALQLFESALPPRGRERDALFDGAASLARPLLDGGSAQEGAEFPLVHGLYWLVANLAEREPLLLTVDDVHWADHPSVRFLAYLGARLEGLRVAALVAFRPRQPNAPAELLAALSDRALRPAPLGAAAVERLVRARFEHAEPGFVRACGELTAGNPFLLEELLRGVADRGEAPTEALGARVAALAPETVLRDVIRRVRRLPAGAAELAAAVAVLGPAATLRAASRLAGLEAAAARQAADALTRVAVLRPGDPLRFVHPLVREVIYEDVPEAARAAAHRHAARLLAGEDAAKDAVAAHLLLAERAGDGWTVDRLADAAAAAVDDGAPQSAVSYLRRALEEPPGAGRRGPVLLALGRAESAAGHPAAEQHLRGALTQIAAPRERAAAAVDLARTLHGRARHEEAAAVIDDALAGLGPAGDERLRRELEATWVSIARLALPLRDRAVERLSAIVELPAGDTHAERVLLAQASGQLVFTGAPREQALALAQRALAGDALLFAGGADEQDWLIALATFIWSDDFQTGERGLLMCLEDARQRGLIRRAANAVYGLQLQHYYEGRVAEAAADAEQALAARHHGWREHLPAACAQLAWARLELDDVHGAAEALTLPELGDVDSAAHAMVLEARARVHAWRGEAQAALDLALDSGRIALAAYARNPTLLHWRSTAAIAAAGVGEVERARELAAEELALARAFGAPRPIGIALRASGLVAGGDDGIDLLRAAVATLADSPARLEHIRALVDLGSVLPAADAGTTLTEALGLAERSGALALERRAREALRSIGASPAPRARRVQDALTPAEQRMAGMAAAGLSDREIAEALFVTINAVQSNLDDTCRKLHINRRDELPAALSR